MIAFDLELFEAGLDAGYAALDETLFNILQYDGIPPKEEACGDPMPHIAGADHSYPFDFFRFHFTTPFMPL